VLLILSLGCSLAACNYFGERRLLAHPLIAPLIVPGDPRRLGRCLDSHVHELAQTGVHRYFYASDRWDRASIYIFDDEKAGHRMIEALELIPTNTHETEIRAYALPGRVPDVADCLDLIQICSASQ
jgi:hypothetical protein